MKQRIEKDSIGEIRVDEDKYWGAQTQRSLKYFSIGKDIMPIEAIHALALIKKAAAIANHELGYLSADKKKYICEVADEIMKGDLDRHFPLHVWMTGSGTQSNMNVNEVISNRAIELSGGIIGSKDPIHPNDDVNMSQSSNDTFPTAMYIASARLIHDKLIPAVVEMAKMLHHKAAAWREIIKIGRTHMQDAVPLTLGQEFSGFAVILDENVVRLKTALIDLYRLPLGGTAVGSGINAPKGFAKAACDEIAKIAKLPFSSADNKFAVMGSHDAVVAAMGAINTLANSLYKIANDIRLLSCGPRAGFHELEIPANEPGSSIMPGKVNPTQCEAMAMAAAQVMGNNVAVTIGGASGLLQMNVYKPLMIYNVIQSIHILADCSHNFSEYLLKDTKANTRKIDYYLHQSLMLVTALSPEIGYDKASHLAHYAYEHDLSLSEANKKLELLSEARFNELMKPENML
ncbi:MAG: class II fumarate hydratase [Francisellaceae bacterium]